MKRTTPRRGEDARGKPQPRGGRARTLVVLCGLLALGAALLWLAGNDSRPSRDSQPAPRPELAMDPREAYTTALGLVNQRRFLESLPWFREALRGGAGFWRVHHDYAAALLNAVHESRERQGVLGFVVRASPERVAMVREALEHLLVAERLAGSSEPRGVALARQTRAQAMRAWGFPWEALVTYRQAEWADSSWQEVAGRADALLELLEHPAEGRD